MSSLHDLTLGDVLREHRRTYRDRIGLVCGETRLTYEQLDERVNRLASAMRQDGFGKGDRVLWLGQNCHRLLELLLASSRLGGMMCPANWRGSAEELAFVIEDFDPRIVIWQEEEIGEQCRAAIEAAQYDGRALRHDGDSEYEAFLASGMREDPNEDVSADDPALVLYTAAFGGRPNGAMLTHRNLLSQSALMAMVQDIDAEYSFCNSGPLFHMGTFMTTIPTFHFGGRNVMVRRVDAEALCRTIQDERCNGAFLMPPTIAEMVELNQDGRYDLRSLRSWPNASPEWAAMTSRDESRWGRLVGGYGQTEVMGLATFNGLGAASAGSHGRPSPLVQVRIVDPDGNDVAPGDTGEIAVRGPVVTPGYWNRDDLNAQRTRGGWWHTNDLGRREPDGSISFIGPKMHMIKSAAENIYPAEVEACIEKHPAVREAAVIGVPDPKWHQSVKAIVVLHDGQQVAESEIVEWCRERIASYKKPRHVVFADGPLPRAGFAKDYAKLDAEHGGGNYPGG